MSIHRILERGSLAAALALCLLLPGAMPASAETKSPAAPPAAKAVQKVDLNTATEAQLVELPRIGPATAKAILEYRKQVGTIKSVDELVNVKGIGEKSLEALRPYLMVASAGSKS